MATHSATKRSTAKKSAAKKSTAKKSTAKKSTAKKSAAKQTAARKSAANKATAKKSTATKAAGQYTKPALRERIKRRIMAGTKGGRAGQWSARKAQLLAHEYEAEGGGYTGARSAGQKHLAAWTDEEWQTADGKPARRGATTARYLPKKAWDALTPAEKRATERKKRSASKSGRQFAPNTERAAAARRGAAKKTAAKKAPAKKTTTTKRAAAKRA